MVTTLLSLLILSTAFGGDIYMREDENGTISFTDSPTTEEFTVFIGDMAPPEPINVNTRTYPMLNSFDHLLHRASASTGLPFELIKAVCVAESGMNSNAISSAGAQGLMQIMPATAVELGVEDAFDPEQSIDGGARYLATQLERFGSHRLALAAYNAGPANVVRHNGIPPFEETQHYVDKVMALWAHFRYLRGQRGLER
jgi:soluble lytic murein transglycosylase-like protein